MSAVQIEAVARRVARGAKGAGRVVDEGAVVEHSQRTPLEVLEATVRVDQLGVARERHGHRVEREVTAREVLAQRRRLDLRQRAGLRVGLAAGGGKIELEASGVNRCRREALVGADLSAQAPAHGSGVALDCDVEVGSVPTEQEVAHRAADEICGRAGSRLAHAIEAREGPQALGDPLGLDLGSLRRHRLRFRGPFGTVPYHDGPRGWVVC